MMPDTDVDENRFGAAALHVIAFLEYWRGNAGMVGSALTAATLVVT